MKIDEIILKCLKKIPDERFQTMEELTAVWIEATKNCKPTNLVNLVMKTLEKIRITEEKDSNSTAVPSSDSSEILSAPQTDHIMPPIELTANPNIEPGNAYILILRDNASEIKYFILTEGR